MQRGERERGEKKDGSVKVRELERERARTGRGRGLTDMNGSIRGIKCMCIDLVTGSE